MNDNQYDKPAKKRVINRNKLSECRYYLVLRSFGATLSSTPLINL